MAFHDQLPEGMTEAQRQFAATHLAGTQKMRLSEIRALRAYNPDFLCLHYQLGLGCGAADFIIADAWTSDWAYVTTQESFFLHNPSSQRVHQAAWDWYVMDITSAGGVFNSGFPAYWMATCLSRITTNEDDGVFADSFTIDGYFDQCDPSHPWFQEVDQCLANWIPSLDAYGAAIKSRFDADGRGYLFIPNLGGLITSWDTTNYRMGHGGMIEDFCYFDAGDYFDLGDWQLQQDRAIDLIGSDPIIICQSYINDAANLGDRMFAMASYLLVKGNHTYISLIVNDGLEYYPEYTLNLGVAAGSYPAALADLWDDAWQVYVRRYANGLVLVNPDTTARTITLPGTNYFYVTASGGGTVDESGEYGGALSYAAVTSFVMEAHSGAVLLSASTNSAWTPVAADFDGDRLADLALYDETGSASTSGQPGTWMIRLSSRGYRVAEMNGWLGEAGWTPVAGDADGDGKADPAVYEPITGSWSLRFSSIGYQQVLIANLFGSAGWIGLLADFDGDGKADPAIVGENTGIWAVKLSSARYLTVIMAQSLGGDGCLPVAADFDGDGFADPAVCNPPSGTWLLLLSGAGYRRVTITGLLGEANALPVAADFDGDRLADPAIYRPAVFAWRALLSSSGYHPVNVNAW